MPFQPVPDTAHLKIQGRVDGQLTINDLYFKHTTGTITGADLQTLCTLVGTWFGAELAPLFNEAYEGTKIVGRDLTDAAGFVAEQSLVGVVGLVSGEAAPNNCSMAVSFRTPLAGRNFRGRNYVPVLSNSEVTGNNIDLDFIANVIAAYKLLIFPGSSSPPGWSWSIVSRVFSGVVGPIGLATEITNVTVTDNIVDSMRTRLPGRGQ